jgi:membrane protease YdiL (CAAX protease family)
MQQFRSAFILFTRRYSALLNALICSLLLFLFSFFILFAFPLKMISLTALAGVAFFLSKAGEEYSLTNQKFTISGYLSVYTILGVVLGILLAIFYRWYLGISLLPQSCHLFVLIAALIGTIEEVVFRGVIQDQAKSVSVPFSIFFSTVSHTVYKCCLFLSPAAIGGINVANLAFWTFIFGLVCGYLKQRSGSIIPTIIAHAVFDVLVYAEFARAPWWVW